MLTIGLLERKPHHDYHYAASVSAEFAIKTTDGVVFLIDLIPREGGRGLSGLTSVCSLETCAAGYLGAGRRVISTLCRWVRI